MTNSLNGLLAGLILAIAAIVGGFNGFLLAFVLGVVGLLLAGALSGELDLSAMRSGRGRG
ncbi:DUF2273 domain-containing protein [Georgenia sp. AZ-5]|uniref:DUF2273 domain-containing protein n=1 Tax=Georgenia sp. AZ-5 TaxID=3367526 RepID=UPI0037542557